MEIIVRGRQLTVPSRFRQHATAKLSKLEKLDQKAVRIDVEVSKERNPRQSDRRERVELTIRSRGPAIRAEAAADDRYAALDLAFAKLESRLRRASDRRKIRHTDNDTLRSPAMVADEADASSPPPPALNGHATARPRTGEPADQDDGFDGTEPDSPMVPIQMEGDGPLVLREKVTRPSPCRSTRPCWRWNWWVMISTCSMTATATGSASSTAAGATTTGSSAWSRS